MKRAKMNPNHGNAKHGRGRAAVGGYEVVKESLPRVDNRAVPCPTCGALVKESCVSGKTGKPTNSSHPSRRRMAVRKYNAETEQRAAAEAERNEGRVECPVCHVLIFPRADGRVRKHEPNQPGTSHVGGTAHCAGTGQPPSGAS